MLHGFHFAAAVWAKPPTIYIYIIYIYIYEYIEYIEQYIYIYIYIYIHSASSQVRALFFFDSSQPYCVECPINLVGNSFGSPFQCGVRCIETDLPDTPLKDSDPTHWNGWVFTLTRGTCRELASPYLAGKVYPGIITGTPRNPTAGLPGEQQKGREIARVGRKPTGFWVAKMRGDTYATFGSALI